MKQELIEMLNNMKKYNSGTMCKECFGFDTDTVYDALVVAPGWKPTKIIKDESYKVTQLNSIPIFRDILLKRTALR